MNLIKLYASFAIIQCKRFIQCLESSLRETAFTAQIIRNAVLTCGFSNQLDTSGTLHGEKPSGLHRGPLMRLARGVAVAIGLSLSVGITPADGISQDSIDPKRYIKLHYSDNQSKCLIKLYGKESAFNPKAVGNLKGKIQAYGIPQLKNPIIKDLSPIKQIDYGIKYLNHRYSNKPCLALAHSNRKGWY